MLAFGVVTAVALPRNYDQNVYQFLHFRTADEQQLRAQWREWIAGVFITQEHPLLGVGPGNFQQNLANAYGAHGLEYPGKARPGADLASGLMEPDTNNLYVVTAATTGLLGLAALLWMLIYFGKTASAVVRRPGAGGPRAGTRHLGRDHPVRGDEHLQLTPRARHGGRPGDLLRAGGGAL